MANLLSEKLTTVEAAREIGVSVATLKRWRKQGSGPPYLRLGPRIIRYRLVDIELWQQKNKAH